jgi:hypothetical protein
MSDEDMDDCAMLHHLHIQLLHPGPRTDSMSSKYRVRCCPATFAKGGS